MTTINDCFDKSKFTVNKDGDNRLKLISVGGSPFLNVIRSYIVGGIPVYRFNVEQMINQTVLPNEVLVDIFVKQIQINNENLVNDIGNIDNLKFVINKENTNSTGTIDITTGDIIASSANINLSRYFDMTTKIAVLQPKQKLFIEMNLTKTKTYHEHPKLANFMYDIGETSDGKQITILIIDTNGFPTFPVERLLVEVINHIIWLYQNVVDGVFYFENEIPIHNYGDFVIKPINNYDNEIHYDVILNNVSVIMSSLIQDFMMLNKTIKFVGKTFSFDLLYDRSILRINQAIPDKNKNDNTVFEQSKLIKNSCIEIVKLFEFIKGKISK